MSKSSASDPSFWAGALLFPFALLFYGLCCVWEGYVLSTLWNWFAVLFTPIRLSVATAIGIDLLLSLARGLKYRKYEDDEAGKAIVYGIIAPGMLLAVGFVAHLYMHGAA